MSPRNQQFAALPADVQDQLLRIARLVAGMEPHELAAADELVNIARVHFVTRTEPHFDPYIPAAEAFSALGRIVTHHQKGV